MKNFAPFASLRFHFFKNSARSQNADAQLTPWRKTRWQALTPGPTDRPWGELLDASRTALEHFRTNPLARAIVRTTTAFVVGPGIHLSSARPEVEAWLRQFWAENGMDDRLEPWSNALVLDGEIFPLLFVDRRTGRVAVRARPRIVIDQIEADPEDYETELRYHEMAASDRHFGAEGRWWPSPKELGRWGNREIAPPVMLHYAINRPIGALRGEGDLDPLLPWLRRYHDWLLDRVKLNKYRSRFYWWVRLTGAAEPEIEAARERYATPPPDGSIIVTGDGEEWTVVTPRIEAGDAKDDGRAIEKMVAAGSGHPLHWLGEVESATRSTAKDANTPAYRLLAARQRFFVHMLTDFVTQALRLAADNTPAWPWPTDDLQLSAQLSDLTQDDNLSLAQAAASIATALEKAVAQGWLDSPTAAQWLAKFAGEG